MNSRIRICNVSYLNSTPYSAIRKLPWVDYSEAVPADASRQLHEGTCDLACIPLAEFAAHGGYEALDYGIVADKHVDSVALFSQVPISQVTTVLLDTASRTSVVLLRLLLEAVRRDRGADVLYRRCDAATAAEQIIGSTAALVIGDAALEYREHFPFVYDLASLWYEQTGLPFVFAVWAARPSALSLEQVSELREAFAEGVAHRESFARTWAEEHSFQRDEAVRYLNDCIRYVIDEEAQRGAKEFLMLGYRAGLLPHCELMSSNSGEHSSTNSNLMGIADRKRLSVTDGVQLAEHATLGELALIVDSRRREEVQGNRVSIPLGGVIALSEEGDSLSPRIPSQEEIVESLEELIVAGAQLVMLKAAHCGELDFEYYLDLLRFMNKRASIDILAFSAADIYWFSQTAHAPCDEVLDRLRSAGLSALCDTEMPLLLDRAFARGTEAVMSPCQWLDIHRTAHRLGLPTICSITFDPSDSWYDRVLHLHRIRSIQDETEGFSKFVLSESSRTRERGEIQDLLRLQTISYLFLDNFSSFLNLPTGVQPSLAQIGLFFGITDFAVLREQGARSWIFSAAREQRSDVIERYITDAGFTVNS